MLGVLKSVFASGALCIFLSSAAYGEHSDFQWHLLKSRGSMDHCQRGLNEGRLGGMQPNANNGYNVALYFGGNLYQIEFQFGQRLTGCKAYRISQANRQSQRRYLLGR